MEEKEMKMFALRLFGLMEANGITQQELCRRTGINKGSMSQYVNGIYLPKPDKLKAIADALGTTDSFLLGLEDSPARDHYALSSFEEELLDKYKEADELTQQMVKRLLKME